MLQPRNLKYARNVSGLLVFVVVFASIVNAQFIGKYIKKHFLYKYITNNRGKIVQNTIFLIVSLAYK